MDTGKCGEDGDEGIVRKPTSRFNRKVYLLILIVLRRLGMGGWPAIRYGCSQQTNPAIRLMKKLTRSLKAQTL